MQNLLRDNTNCNLTRSRKIRKGKPKFKWFSERKDVSKSGLNMRESQEDKNSFVNSRPHCFKYQKNWSESNAYPLKRHAKWRIKWVKRKTHCRNKEEQKTFQNKKIFQDLRKTMKRAWHQVLASWKIIKYHQKILITDSR